MSKLITSSTYFELNDLVNEALDNVYSTTQSHEYRVIVKMAIEDFVRNSAHYIPEEKAIELIEKIQNDLLRATAVTVLAQAE